MSRWRMPASCAVASASATPTSNSITCRQVRFSARAHVVESAAIDVLRDEILTTIEGAGLVHGHDMRVLAERGECAHFAAESMTCLFAVERTQQELYCDGPRVKARVGGEVDLPMPPAAIADSIRYAPISVPGARAITRGDYMPRPSLVSGRFSAGHAGAGDLRLNPLLAIHGGEPRRTIGRATRSRRSAPTFQRSANTRIPSSDSPYSIVDSSQSSRGG